MAGPDPSEMSFKNSSHTSPQSGFMTAGDCLISGDNLLRGVGGWWVPEPTSQLSPGYQRPYIREMTHSALNL